MLTAMETGNNQQVNLILKQYKEPNGLVKFDAVLRIPPNERIPALAQIDFSAINMVIIGALTMAMKSLNLKHSLNEIQILDLSEAIIDTSHEDNLAFEDLMLFLQKLVRGEYEVTSDSINIPKFMKLFEVYRQKRYEELNRIRDEQHTQFKAFGNQGKHAAPDILSEHFSKLGSRLSDMKDAISYLKEENKNLKMDNF